MKPSRTAIISWRCGPSEIRSNGATSWSRMIGMSRAIAPVARAIAHTAIIPSDTTLAVNTLYEPRRSMDFMPPAIHARALVINRENADAQERRVGSQHSQPFRDRLLLLQERFFAVIRNAANLGASVQAPERPGQPPIAVRLQE